MNKKEYDKNYDINSSLSSVKKFYRQRRMFAIKDDMLYIAPEDIPYTHTVWFEKKGWVTPGNDEIIKSLVRGFVDLRGIFFYKDCDFQFDRESEKRILRHLDELVKKLKINSELHLYGGLVRKKPGEKWPGKKDYGSIEDLVINKET